MANIKSAKKRILVTERKTAINRSRKSELKTYIKKFEAALNSGEIEKAKAYLKDIESRLDRAAAKNTIHKNAAARKISRLRAKLNKTA